jgi:hypothetical protein
MAKLVMLKRCDCGAKSERKQKRFSTFKNIEVRCPEGEREGL